MNDPREMFPNWRTAAAKMFPARGPETTRETEQHKSLTALRGLGAYAPKKSLMTEGFCCTYVFDGSLDFP
jgi:hypothetical protein